MQSDDGNNSSECNVQDTVASEELEEIKSGTKAKSSDKCLSLHKIPNNLLEIKELSTIATQTPLTLIRFTLTQPSLDKQSVVSTSPARCSPEAIRDVNNLILITRSKVLSETSVTLSREVMTQATPPHPSLTRSISTTHQDTLEVSNLLASSNSGLKNEIVTVTTNYGSPLPDECSVVIDRIDQIGNQEFRSSVQESYGCSRVLNLTAENEEAVVNSRSVRRSPRRWWSSYNCLRCMSAANDESDTRTYMRDAPPAYSAIYNSHLTTRNWRPFRARNQSFIAPIPPPSYAQAQRISFASHSIDRLFSISTNSSRFWSPRPTTAICPRCTTIIVTTIEIRQSVITHITAVALFLCGCWPCCMIPYCMNACKIIDHYCPICHAYLGTYRPC